MLFYAQSCGGLTALATTSMVNAEGGSEAAEGGVGSLNGSIRADGRTTEGGRASA